MADNESFEEPDDDDEIIEESHTTTRRGPPRRTGPGVPDEPIENADATPLLIHAGTGKANTVTYIKVTRIDGPSGPGGRGYKGNVQSDATMADIARKYGNGVYTLAGCNTKHKVLLTEHEVEINMPQFDEQPQRGVPPSAMGGSTAQLHGMRLISERSEAHEQAIQTMATSSVEQTQSLARSTVESFRDFATAQRDSERRSHETQMTNMQTFFAAMQANAALAHAQQMEMITAMNDRDRSREQNPMELVDVLVRGMAMGREDGGEPNPPWMNALGQGTQMLGHLASLAHAPGGAEASRVMATMRNPALPPGQSVQPLAQPPQRPQAAPAANPSTDPSTPRRRRKLPLTRSEMREAAQLKVELRKRGIDLSQCLRENTEHFKSAPDSDIRENDGPNEGSDDARDSSTDNAPEKTPAANVDGAERTGD